MNRTKAIFVVILCVLVGSAWAFTFTSGSVGMIHVVSGVDGKPYLVRDEPDSQKAADVLAALVEDMRRVLETAGEAGPDPALDRIKAWLRKDPPMLSETSPDTTSKGATSVTINKSRIALCLRSLGCHRDSRMFHARDLLMHVFLHECAHVGNEGHGHDAGFNEIKLTLTGLAVRAGVLPEGMDSAKGCYCNVDL